jgi:ABC-type phosphate transport system substrate-binding protein
MAAQVALMRRIMVLSSGYRVAVSLLLCATQLAACTLVLDRDKNQCSSDNDCVGFGGHPACQNNVCVETGLGPDGCFFGTPKTPAEFANQCSTATYEPFDNCERLGLCGPDDVLPQPTMPPGPGGGSGTTPPPPQGVPCIDTATRNTIVVGGSTAIQPFLGVIAPLLADLNPPYQIAYQPSGSCTGVDGLFSPDSSKRNIKDIAGRQALLFHPDGTSEPCQFGDGSGDKIALDVAASDVYASSCNVTYAKPATLGEYFGPIQPMTFVVPADSQEIAISAEMANLVFGRGGDNPVAEPYRDPSLYFVRNSGSGTQQMLARAIGIDAKNWWGIDRGSSGKVIELMTVVEPGRRSNALGILSTDFADKERQKLNLRILAFKGTGQTSAYYPDSTQFTNDKANVRDGHYSIWGPVHFYAVVDNSVPTQAGASAFLSLFTQNGLARELLDVIIRSGLVPTCAMKVKRDTEMGPLSAYSPQGQCGCYFEAHVPGGAAPASCQTCAGPADCPSNKQACNFGYCEVQ